MYIVIISNTALFILSKWQRISHLGFSHSLVVSILVYYKINMVKSVQSNGAVDLPADILINRIMYYLDAYPMYLSLCYSTVIHPSIV